MRMQVRRLAIPALAIMTGPFMIAQTAAPPQLRVNELSPWWHQSAPGARRHTTAAKKLPLITVKGNKFVDPQGSFIIFRGLAIADPDKVESEGHWGKDLFVKVKEMGANVVRIPVHPVAWRGRTPAEYIKLLDQAVDWCTDLGMYVDLDWHSIGNLTTGLFQDPIYETSLQETYNFWRTMARHYAGHNTVALYELFNEPTTFNGQLGRVVWAEWKKIQEDLIGIIRANNPQAIVLAAGFDWAYDLTPVREAPVIAENIAYVTHPYAHKRSQPWEPKWEEDFGFAAAKYPVVATEFGGAAAPQPGSTVPAYGPSIYRYLESKGISWMVWCFDPEWTPTLISDWQFHLTPAGEFAKKAMQGGILEARP
jgi:endoglucanase